MNQLGAVERRRRNLRIVLFSIILGTLPLYCLGFLLWGTAPQQRVQRTPTTAPATTLIVTLQQASATSQFPSLTPFQFPTQNVPTQQPYIPPPVVTRFASATFVFIPTATNFIFPTSTIAPTLTPFPTLTPAPSETPIPIPSSTPLPLASDTPIPSETPVVIPTNTETPTPTPTPTSEEPTPIPFS